MILADLSDRGARPLVYQRSAAPAGAPVDLARALRHLRLDEADADEIEKDLVTAAIGAATEHLDGRGGILNRALVTQTWTATTDRPAWNIDGPVSGFMLDFGPVQAVTKVEYRTGGAYVALPAGRVRTATRAGGRTMVWLADGGTWPSADRDPEAWRITFRAGYGDAGEAVPAPIRSAMLLMIADLYDNRDGKVQGNLVENPTVDRLLRPYRRVGV